LFSKDIAPFNPDRFKHEIQSPLGLKDVEAFVLEFVSREGRKATPSEAGTVGFLLPECFKGVQGLARRYTKVTFDRAVAIRHSETEFMALGHPLTDSMIHRCGSVDFGGFVGRWSVENKSLAGRTGALFNFVVKVTKATTNAESVFFEFTSVFVRSTV